MLTEYSIKWAAKIIAHTIVNEIPIESQPLDLQTKSVFTEEKNNVNRKLTNLINGSK